jgi:hypothetical protein
MTELYFRLLLWHKLIAQQTGGLALCSVKHKLNREEARGWIEALRNVSDDIQAVLDGAPPVIDSKGRRVVGLDVGTKPEPRFFSKGDADVKQPGHVNPSMGVDGGVINRKNGGPRVLRKKSSA